MSDNISLKYLFDQQNLNARKARWLAFLSEYDFKIKHIKGKENRVVHALNKKVYELHISSCEYDLKTRIKYALVMDEDYAKNYELVQKKQRRKQQHRFNLNQKDLILFKNRMYIPNSKDLKLIIMDACHRKPYSGDPGYRRMITKLKIYIFLAKNEI